MLFQPANFLTLIRFLVTGGGRNSTNGARDDGGFLVDTDNLIGTSVLATSVTRVTDSSGFPILSAAANITAVANVSILVPRDYDEATDELRVRLVAVMSSTNDTPTVTVTPKKRVTGSAAAAFTTASQTTAALSPTPQAFELVWYGEGLKRGNLVELTLTSAAHGNDALQLQALQLSYRSTLVSYHDTDRSVTPIVKDLR